MQGVIIAATSFAQPQVFKPKEKKGGKEGKK
jgi:hypothetical protein